ncbi:MAG TPA: acyltransferase [Vicinamibacterales bacterium]
MTARRINFGNLDALRGMLAVYVALGHCRWLLWSGHAAWLAAPHGTWEAIPAYASGLLRYGREAVMVFFVLSGFFIHYRAADANGREQFRAGPFYKRRWHRLAPPYFFALGVTVALDALGRTWWPALYEARTGDAYLDWTFARGGYSQSSIVPAVLLLPSSLERDFGSNGPLWSLAYEAVYYAIYPLWLWVRQRSALAAFVVIPLLCLALSFSPLGGFPVRVLMYYPIWLVGAALAERLVGAGVPQRPVALGAAAFVIGAAIYLTAPMVLIAIIASVTFGAGLVLAFGGAQSRDRVLLPLFERLGVRSYTIYIVHFPLLALLSASAFETMGRRPMHGWFAVAGAFACVGFGVACFELCERHFLHSRYRDASAAP